MSQFAISSYGTSPTGVACVLADVVARSRRRSPSRRRRRRLSAAAAVFQKVQLTAGRSTVVATDFDVTRIAVTNPDVADAVVVQPREILIDGKKPGTVSLIVWGDDGTRRSTTSSSSSRSRPLEQQLHVLFPGEDVTVGDERGRDDPLRPVSSTNVMLRMGEIAAASLAEGAGHQPAAGAGRQREPAGDAAGALRRSEPPHADGGGPDAVRRPRSGSLARSTTQQFAAPDVRRRGRQPASWCSATS